MFKLKVFWRPGFPPRFTQKPRESGAFAFLGFGCADNQKNAVFRIHTFQRRTTIRLTSGTLHPLLPLNLKRGYPERYTESQHGNQRESPRQHFPASVTRNTDNETGHDPRRDEDNIPLPPDDEAPIEEDMSDVDAADSVASEHPAT